MVEGDGCHRVAARHRQTLVGRKFKATSPNGRFTAGAKVLNKAGGVLLRIEVHGKNLFYFFGAKGGKPAVVVHIHFGMAGQFAAYTSEVPEATSTIRLCLEAVAEKGKPRVVAHLSAMTVQHGRPEQLYVTIAAKLGPDPLRADAKAEQFLAAVGGQKKSIGLCLMDQSLVAGLGNIYRSETLYEAGIHPEQPSNTVPREALLKLWRIVVRQMQAGFTTGSVWGKKKGPSCYSRATSECGGKVREWMMAGRNVYACAKRQRLDKTAKVVTANPKTIKTGTAHLGKMVSAAAAEGRKRKTGEGMAVQHVALKDDATLAGARKARSAAAKRSQTKAKAKVRAKAKAKSRATGKAKVKAMKEKAKAPKRRRSSP